MATIIRDVRDKLQAALDVKFGYNPRRDQRLTESERRAYPGPEQVPSIREIIEHIQEATTANVPYMLGVSQTRAMIQHLEPEESQEWRSFVTVGKTKNFKTQERIMFGEFGNMPKRAERQAYANLGFPPEYRTPFTPENRGGMVDITREMLLNDDIGALQSLPKKLAAACNDTNRKFAYGLLAGNSAGGAINSDTLHDTLVLYHASHGNLASGALDVTNLLAARARLLAQWLPGQETVMDDTGGVDASVTTIGVESVEGFYAGGIIRIGTELIKIGAVDSELSRFTGCTRGMYGTTAAIHADAVKIQLQARPVRPKSLHLIVPTQLESTAWEMVSSEKVPGGNYNNRNFLNKEHEEGRLHIVAVHPTYLGDDLNNWYLAADAESVPSLEIAFLEGEEMPEVIVQDVPAVGDVFKMDVITYKARQTFGGAQVDWRGVQGNLV